MADEGMMLNLVSNTTPVVKKHKAVGGRWTDRAKINKRETRRVRQALPKPAPVSEPVESHSQDVTAEKSTDYRPNLKRKRQEALKGKAPVEGEEAEDDTRVAGQVVASLFDYHDPLPAMKPAVKRTSPPEAITPSNAPLNNDDSSFAGLGIVPEVVTTMSEKLSIEKPTIIQKRVLQVMLKTDKDVFIQAQTGSGKTLAYLLPIVNRLCQIPAGLQSRDRGCFALIVAPTRELAQQIYHVVDTLLNSHRARWIVPVLLIGGEKKKSEKARLRKGANIVIATPGRLKDHLDSTKNLDVRAISWVILDEGDRLMDLGFEATIVDILKIISDREGRRISAPAMPERRITVICSATAKKNVEELGQTSLRDAIFIETGNKELQADRQQSGTVAPAQLKQEFLVVPTKLRMVTLVALLKKLFGGPKPAKKVICFFSCGDTVDWHFKACTHNEAPMTGSNAAGPEDDKPVLPSISKAHALLPEVTLHKLHGSLDQQMRKATLHAFATTEEPALLFCTDVASRGLDLQVSYVIQYDPPFSIDDYTHRIGRTARAGKNGSALLFTLKSESAYLELIRETLHCDLNELNVKFLLKAGFGAQFEEGATAWQLAYEKFANQAGTVEQAKRAYTSHVRAYATHISAERSCFPMHALQLGHVAKSFGLRDAPSNIKSTAPPPVKKHRKQAEEGSQDKRPGPAKVLDVAARMRHAVAQQSRAGGMDFNIF
ncbi:P-loop containing nucleoside triphosphate hydrolase protein [Protomyces lactucae-debilis]|uniref:ATP-dependent RNA helicase n=1 Tax=Protomyces lactucae-debilis TaxID=2754530 RepID=A0A1Y2F903_PROLT|nr:P-loop containing nucleoside triphosphate hydrolase protein [Protomyces lactucae-debilis]ORY80398.1 P-loop containing nucleoside triphosphate hydrolase protein [Protomyces lactucae-debilis]